MHFSGQRDSESVPLIDGLGRTHHMTRPHSVDPVRDCYV